MMCNSGLGHLQWRIPILLLGFVLNYVSALASSDQPIVVAGAGPAALFFSLKYLSRDPSAHVTIYEQRPRPQKSSSNQGFTGFQAFGFGLGGRAKGLFEKIPGLSERILSVTEESKMGRWYVNHQDMCAVMIDELESRYGSHGDGRLKMIFETPVVSVKDDCSIIVETKSGEECVPYSLLIAADGINSIIRSQLVEEKLIRCSRYFRNVAWKALKLSPQPKLTPGFAQLYGQEFVRAPKKEFGGLLPRYKSQFVLLMFWRRNRSTTQTNPFNATTPDELKAKIQEQFPNVTIFPSDHVLQGFINERPGREVYMKLNKHALPKRRIALIGDTAVGMFSNLGQGVTSGMERANLLAETLPVSADNANGKQNDLSRALKTFSKYSVREGHAITDLNLMSHAWDHPWTSVGPAAGMQEVAPLINNPDLSYSELSKRPRFRKWITIGKLLWRFQRLPDNIDD